MRLNNRKRIPFFNFILTVINVALAIFLVVWVLEESDFGLFSRLHGFFIIVPGTALLFFLLGRQVFEYDSNSEKAIIKSRGLVPFFRKPLHFEIEKSKITSYRVKGFFPRLLQLDIRRGGHNERHRFDLTYLSRKEVQDLKTSLHRILKSNAYR